jgi:hypothetical protein
MEYDNLGLTFIRWNGGGDLFEESVAAVNYLAKMRPDIVIWVVTRMVFPSGQHKLNRRRTCLFILVWINIRYRGEIAF